MRWQFAYQENRSYKTDLKINRIGEKERGNLSWVVVSKALAESERGETTNKPVAVCSIPIRCRFVVLTKWQKLHMVREPQLRPKMEKSQKETRPFFSFFSGTLQSVASTRTSRTSRENVERNELPEPTIIVECHICMWCDIREYVGSATKATMEKFLVSCLAFGSAAFASHARNHSYPMMEWLRRGRHLFYSSLNFRYANNRPSLKHCVCVCVMLPIFALTLNTKTISGDFNSHRRVYVRRRCDVRTVSLSRSRDQKIDKLFPFDCATSLHVDRCPAEQWVIACDSHTMPWRGFKRPVPRCTGHHQIFIHVFVYFVQHVTVRQRQYFFQFQGIHYYIYNFYGISAHIICRPNGLLIKNLRWIFSKLTISQWFSDEEIANECECSKDDAIQQHRFDTVHDYSIPHGFCLVLFAYQLFQI